MKFQIGDNIILLLSKEEGKVVGIINEAMVKVEVNGISFPAYIDQIDFPYFYRFTHNNTNAPKENKKLFIDNIPTEKNTTPQAKKPNGVWLALIPQFSFDEWNDEIVENLKIHVLNNTNVAYTFEYQQNYFTQNAFKIKNELQPFQNFYLHNIPFETVNDNLSFTVYFSLLNSKKNKVPYFQTILKIKPKKIFYQIEQMKEKNEPMISYLLFEEYPEKLIPQQFEVPLPALSNNILYNANNYKANTIVPKSIIDLHIEKIIADYKHLSNYEILTIQLKEFEKWYQIAVNHFQPNLIVIHGIGKGKLKEEIHQILKNKHEVDYFNNDYDGRFGYGATSIFFKY